ncbi:MAG: hypothetical protein L3J91_01070 [Thermoplasmata archaeon]|nr:hypothetical protein [Thermoplasmata archaeon]
MAASPSLDGFPGGAVRGGGTLDRLSLGMLVLLSIEFVLGMALALFVSLPSGTGVVALLRSYPVLDLHLLLALFIVGIALRAVALARGAAARGALYASVLALVSALVATVAGWAFAFDGQNPDASFVMALGFLGVLVGAFALRGHGSTAEEPRFGGREAGR